MNAQKRLLKAMAECLETKPIDQITVGDLADAADVSRQTFYRLYPDKYELLKDYYRTTIESFYPDNSSFEDVYQGCYKTIEFYRDHPNVVRNMFFSKDGFSLKQYFRELCYENDLHLWRTFGANVDDPRFQGALREYAYGTVSWLMQWIKEGMPGNLTELTEQFMLAIPVGMFFRDGTLELPAELERLLTQS